MTGTSLPSNSNDWKPRLADLWDWRGETGRIAFTFWALLLCALKICINLAILPATAATPRTQLLKLFLILNGPTGASLDLSAGDIAFLCITSLPFLWAGTVLTIRRLRSAGLHPLLALFIFAPYAKVVLAAVLCVLHPASGSGEPSRPGWLGRIIPAGRLAALVALLITVALASGVIIFATKLLESYAWTLFATIPAGFGVLCSLLFGYHQQRRLAECIALSMTALLITGGILFVLLIEGAICIAMAAPIVAALVLVGTFIGYIIQMNYWNCRNRTNSTNLVLMLLPASLALETALPQPIPLHAVTTTIEIAAPPAAVWKNVVTFSTLPEPTEWIFKTGLAYPTHAEITGTGPGAIRRCCFSTGDFIEPITVWDEPRTLAFSVEQNPPPMTEFNPFGHVEAAHLHGYMMSERGQFQLVDLGDGRTRLEGTTWYRHGLFPAAYWRMWSDFVIHRIHLRVLRHVKTLTENPDAAARSPLPLAAHGG